MKAAILSGQTKHIDNSQMTISQWMDMMDIWYETKKRRWKISTRQQRKKIIENHIKPLIGKYRLSLLGSNTDKDFESRTVLTYHSTFKIAINAAVEVEIILRNRFTSITIDQDDVLDNFLLPGEFEHIFVLC